MSKHGHLLLYASKSVTMFKVKVHCLEGETDLNFKENNLFFTLFHLQVLLKKMKIKLSLKKIDAYYHYLPPLDHKHVTEYNSL